MVHTSQYVSFSEPLDCVVISGIFFVSIMIIVSVSLVFTILVLNFHYRDPSMDIMPEFVSLLLSAEKQLKQQARQFTLARNLELSISLACLC